MRDELRLALEGGLARDHLDVKSASACSDRRPLCASLWPLSILRAGWGAMPPIQALHEAEPARDLRDSALAQTASHALDARMQLVVRAQQTLDVQYYFIAEDATGIPFLQALSDAFTTLLMRIESLLAPFVPEGLL